LAAVVGGGRLLLAGSVEQDLWEETNLEAGCSNPWNGKGEIPREEYGVLEATEVCIEGRWPPAASRIR
jgi:hypothetical protein